MLLCGIAPAAWARGSAGVPRTTIAAAQHTLRRNRSILCIGAAIVAEN